MVILFLKFLGKTSMSSPSNVTDLVQLSLFCAPGTLIKAFNNKDGDSMYHFHEVKENRQFEYGYPSRMI